MNFKNLSLFYKIYFSALIVFAVLLVSGAIGLNIWLADYNKGIPETVSENFFVENFVNLNVDNIVELSGIKPCEFETEDDIKAFLTDEFSKNQLSYTSISTGNDSSVKNYIVKSGEYKIAGFTLTADSKNDYHADSLTLYLPKNLNKQYTVLNSSKLYINGVAVSDEYITSREEHISAQFLEEHTAKPEWVTYTITGLTKEPEATVTDRNGNSPALAEANNGYIEDIIYDEPEQEIVDRLLTAAKQYAICMQNDASKASVLKYFVKGTDLYSSILGAENMFVWNHSGYSFKDVKVSEFFRYDENTVSCRIAFAHCLHKSGYEDYEDRTDITYLAKNVNGEYMIFARYNN